MKHTYKRYPLYRILLRRFMVILLVVTTLPVMLFMPKRAKYSSYLHRVWCKTSDKPVWLAQSERTLSDFY